MKKLFILTFLLLIFTYLHAQNYSISFAGSGESTIVESVEVENINTGEMLAFPGNQVLHLVSEGVGVSNLINNDNGDIRIFPNPITESSTIEFSLSNQGKTSVEILDVFGKEVALATNILDAGRHSFIITGLRRGIYAIKVYSNEFSCTSKLMSNSQTSSEPIITYNGSRNLISSFVNMKSAQTDVVMLYHEGDRLKITGESGVYCTTITEIPDQSKVITVPFMKCTDADGNNYSVVKIGNQYWTVENLKTTRYNDGALINNVTDGEKWINLTTGAWCNYNNIKSNGEIYGKLYNWYAIGTNKLAPKGWHVPTDEEWTILVKYLIDNGYNYDGSKEGNKIGVSLSSEIYWDFDEEDAEYLEEYSGIFNNSGFTGHPGGSRYGGNGYFEAAGGYGDWWSSTEYNEYRAYGWLLTSGLTRFDEGDLKRCGLSVRCVKDDDSHVTLPTVTTSEITNITQTSATSGGNISSDGGVAITARGVCWNTNGNPTVADNNTTDGSGTASFTSSISGLRANTTYYVRAYATNRKGTEYGSVRSFKTLEDSSGGQNEKIFKVYPIVTVKRPNCDKESITTNSYIRLYESYENDGITVKYKNGSYSTHIGSEYYILRRGTQTITVLDDECLGHPYISNGRILYWTYHSFIIKMTFTITGNE